MSGDNTSAGASGETSVVKTAEPSPVRARGFVLAAVLILILSACVLPFWMVELPVRLLFGWGVFLVRVVPRISFAPAGLATAFASTAVLVLTFRRLLHRRTEDSSGASLTGWSRSLRFLVIPPLLFAAGTGFIGIAKTSIWLGTTEVLLVNAGRRAANRSQSRTNLKQMGLGFFGYEDQEGALPPGGLFDQTGRGLHSWATHLLPFLEETRLHEQVNWKEPWQSPGNRSAMQTEVSVLMNPGLQGSRRRRAHGYAPSHYAANVRVLGANSRLRLKDIRDGTSNTIFAGEVNQGIRPWGDPLNWRDPTAGINSPNGFGMWVGGCHVLLGDGTVRFISETIDPNTLRQLSDPADGETVGPF